MFPANPFLQVQKKLSSVYKPGFDICGEVRGEKTGQWTVLLFTIRNNVGKLKKLEGKCSENMLQHMNSSGVQASMLIQMHSLIFGRLLHVWLFWNQSVYIYRFYGFVQIPECWPRLWDVPGAKCMEISPCRYACCATMKLCDGQCCSRCGVHSVSKKTCCLESGDDHCELVGPQPHAHQGTVVVVAIGLGLVLLVLLVLSLSCLFLRRFHSVRESLLNPPQPAVSLLDLASNSPRGQVVAPTSTTTSIPGGQVVARTRTSTTTSIPDRCDLCPSRQQMSRFCPGCQHRQVVCHRCNRQQPRCNVCTAGVIDYVSDSIYASESASYPPSSN